MGDPTGGAAGGLLGATAPTAPPPPPSDPSLGMGGVDPGIGWSGGVQGGDLGSSFGSFGGQMPGDPTGSLGAQQAIQGPQGAQQQPLTDQPSSSLPSDPASAARTLPQSASPDWLQQVQALGVNHALFNGPTALTGTPGTPASNPPLSPGTPGSEVPGTRIRTPWGTGVTPFNTPVTEGNPLPIESDSLSNVISRYAGRGVAGGLLNAMAPTPLNAGEPQIPQTGTAPPTRADQPPLTQEDLTGIVPEGSGVGEDPRGGAGTANAPMPQPRPSPGQDLPAGAVPTPQPRPSPGQDLPVPPTGNVPPTSTASAGPMVAPGNTGMGGGAGMQGSPLEQMVGQFIHMLMGGLGGGRGGIGSMLEQMIDRALGINPQRGFSPFFGGGFNPPPPSPGSGYFPPGTTGGRPAAGAGTGTGAPPLPRPAPGLPGSQENSPLRHTPGSPGTPGSYTPSNYARALVKIESGGNLNERTGSNTGLVQFGPDEYRKYMHDIPRSLWHTQRAQMIGLQREAADHTNLLRRSLGRDPTPAELYLTHQQGVGGGPALLKANPNTPAWQALRQIGVPERTAKMSIGHIFDGQRHSNAGNIPSDNPLYNTPVEQITAGQFVNMWRDRFNRAMQ